MVNIQQENKKSCLISPKFIDVLDGVRALSVIIVLIFHFWQQTWVWPSISTPLLSFLGINAISLNNYAKVGYLFVDMMVLLSGFLLFLPLARQVILGEERSSWKQYAKKRVARILPSYLFCVITIFIIAVVKGEYSDTTTAIRDLLTHLTFTQTLFVDTYFSTKLNVVLWTVAIEVWFYILYPFIADFIGGFRFSKKKVDNPKGAVRRMLIVAAVMFICFEIFRRLVVNRQGAYVAFNINQFPAFLGVYAIGMIGSFLMVALSNEIRRTPGVAYFSLVVAAFSLVVIDSLVADCAVLSLGEAQLWQVNERFKLNAVFAVFIISLALSPDWIRWLFSNRLMRFLSAISYNLYIWHQWLAVRIKYVWRIPSWTGDTPPNQLNDTRWMNQYALIITIAAVLAAVLATYLIEKPMSKLLLGGYKKKSGFGVVVDDIEVNNEQVGEEIFDLPEDGKKC